MVEHAGSQVPLALRDAALLAWLAIEGPTSRTRLARLLWPDSEPETGRNSLRQRLFQLKRQTGVELVVGPAATLALAADVSHDLHDADSVLGDTRDAIGVEFDAWLSLQHARRRGRVGLALVELCDAAERAGDWADALIHAGELLAIDPLSEAAHCRVMRLHYLAGDRAAALRAFDRCEQVLKHDVGARPSDETLALLATIERGAPAAHASLRQLPAALLRPPRLVGREAELRQLLEAWNLGSPFVLVGEAGVGKSRLLGALVEVRPGTVLVRARPGDAAVPLALLARLVAQYSAQRGAEPADPALAELAKRLAPAASPQPDTQRPVSVPLNAALHALFERAQSDATALLFDDWQFADNASVALIGELVQAASLPDLRLGFASRGADAVAQARIVALRQASTVRLLELQPLGPQSVLDLLASLVGAAGERDAPDLASVAGVLYQRVGGNPLFVLEALRHMHHQQLPLTARHMSVPRRVSELVAERLAQLPEAARALLHVAAVAGSDFSVELAEAVSARHALELAPVWHQLERQALFGPAGVAHDVHAEVVLDSLPAPIARLLHARVATWLEPRAHEPARLAAHWRAAGDDLRAVPHLRAAAHCAWRAARAEETFDLFCQAAEIEGRAGRGGAAFDLWFEAADAMTEIGPAASIRGCLVQLERHAQTEVQQLRTRFVRAALRTVEGKTKVGMAEAAAMLTEAIALGDSRIETECRYAIAYQATADARFDDAVQHLAVGERLLRAAGDERRATTMAAMMALLLGLRGQARLAAHECARMLPLVKQHGDLTTWAVVSASHALQCLRRGEHDCAIAEAQATLEAVERISIAALDLRIVLRSLVDTYRWAGRFDLALRTRDTLALRLGHSSEPDAHACEPSAALYLHLGRSDLAQRHLQALAGDGSAPTRERLRLALWQRQAAPTRPGAAAFWPAEAIDCDDLALAGEWALWSGLAEVSPWPAAALQTLHARCREAGLTLLLAPLAALWAWRSGAPAPLASADGRDAMTPWTALFAARASQASGDRAAAARHARSGRHWLDTTAREHVPEPFRHAFVHRHPAHRELLALVQRLGPA